MISCKFNKYILAFSIIFWFFQPAFSQEFEGENYTDDLGDCLFCTSVGSTWEKDEVGWELWELWKEGKSAMESYMEDMIGDNPWDIDNIFFEDPPTSNEEIPYQGDCRTTPDKKIICPTLETFTIAGPNRKRKTVGIGEEVYITIKDLCGHTTTTWEILGGGKIINQSSNNCLVQANYSGESFRIEATLNFNNGGLVSRCGTGSSSSLTLSEEFKIVKPSGVVFKKAQHPLCINSPETYVHKYDRPSAGFFAKVYLKPTNVNFYKIMVKEGYVKAKTEGKYFDKYPGVNLADHPEDLYYGIGQYVDGYGSEILELDEIYIELACNNIAWADYSGIITYDIPLFYKNEDTGEDFEFIKTPQIGENKVHVAYLGNPFFRIKKGDVKASARLKFPTTSCQILPSGSCP